MHIPSRRSFDALDGLLSPVVTHRLSPPRGAIRTRLSRLLAALGAYRRNRRAGAELSALDDRLLADIGLTRSDLPYPHGSGELADSSRWEAGRGLR